MSRIGTLLCVTGLAWSMTTLWTGSTCCAAESQDDSAKAELMRLGAAAERAGRSADAVAAYEKLLKCDTTYESVLTPRLVDLYIAEGQPAPALSWARRVARRRPDPQAYLAGVHARLSQWKEAELLLRQALGTTKEPRKRLPLLWQLAETQEGQGDGAAAVATLSGACASTEDESLRNTSAQRLAALRQRLDATPANRSAKQAKPKTEAQP